MRVVIVAAPFEGLSSRQTGTALARAWSDLGAEVAVVPTADLVSDATASSFAQSLADLGGPAAACPSAVAEPNAWSTASSSAAVFLLPSEGDLVIADAWPAVRWHDGGAGLAHRLGVRGDRPLDAGGRALAGVTSVDLGPARAALDGRRLVLATTAEELAKSLTGLRGITSVLGHERHDDPALMLATDQALVDWCAALGRPDLASAPAAGACGGVGAIVLALGGEVVTAPQHLAERAGLAATIGHADLVVVGYDKLEFGTKGGDLLPLVTELAGDAMRPVVVVARTNFISARELRTMGVEAGYALAPEGVVPTADEVTESVRGIARTWCW